MKWVCQCVHTHTNTGGRLSGHLQSPGSTGGLMSDLMICKYNIEKSMIIHDTECPYRDQVSLSNTKQTMPLMREPTGTSRCFTQVLLGSVRIVHTAQKFWTSLTKRWVMFLSQKLLFHHLYFLIKYDLGQKYCAPQVQPNRGSNSWPPDHDNTFHVTETPALGHQ